MHTPTGAAYRLTQPRTYAACLLLAALLAAASPPAPRPGGPTLQSLAARRGFTMGAGATDPEQLADPAYAATLALQYGALEPGNSMKMYTLEPAPGVFSFAAADRVAAFAQQHHLHITASAPVWDGRTTDYGNGDPPWLTPGRFPPAQLQTILETYIATTLQHFHRRFPGVVNRWSVVSEATHLCGPLCQGLGTDRAGFPAYIALAYQDARRADPTVQLCYDDWGAEGLGAASDQVFKLVAYLKSRQLIDCVGLEGQWEGSALGSLPRASEIAANINRLGSLGLDVYLSQVEIGIPSSDRGTPTNPADLTAQAETYRSLLAACLSTRACTAFFTWGITDKYAFCWKPGLCAPLPLDAHYRPKPAFYALQQTLADAPAPAAHPAPR